MTFLYAFVCLFAFLALLIQYNYTENKPNNHTQTAEKNNSSSYILKSEDNTLKLYKSNKVIKSYNISPSSLPLTDQDNLRTGIVLDTYEDVLSIIEDFDG